MGILNVRLATIYQCLVAPEFAGRFFAFNTIEIMKEEIGNLPTQTLLLDFNGSIIKYGRNFFLK